VEKTCYGVCVGGFGQLSGRATVRFLTEAVDSLSNTFCQTQTPPRWRFNVNLALRAMNTHPAFSGRVCKTSAPDTAVL